MTICFLLIAGLAFLMIQSAFLFLLPSWVGVPDFVFLVVVHAALLPSLLQSGLAVYLLGITMDATIGSLSGIYPLLYLQTYALMKFFFADASSREPTHKAGLACFFFIIAGASYFLFYALIAPELVMPSWSWDHMVKQIVLLLLVAPGVFRLLDTVQVRFLARRWLPSFLRDSHGNRFRD